MMVVREIISKLLEEVEKLELWFEQDIDDEEEEDEEGEGGSEEVKDTEKEANSKFSFPPGGGPISTVGMATGRVRGGF
ncbi:hypothetical protein Tco_0691705 [Tanacetum coccineum]